MGALRDEKQVSRKARELFTETVEMLWKNRHSLECKFGFSLRIWRFAQNLVSRSKAAQKILYFIYIQSVRVPFRSALIDIVREI
jgi:hypothetical protein